jgi:hypothetical protein
MKWDAIFGFIERIPDEIKENFYGYQNALNLWKNLQQNE